MTYNLEANLQKKTYAVCVELERLLAGHCSTLACARGVSDTSTRTA